MDERVNLRRRAVAGLISMVIGAGCLIGASQGSAGASSGQESTTPAGEVGENATCADLAPEGATWIELKVEPVEDGTFTDGTLTVTIDVRDTDDGQVFDWTSNIGVDAVFVKGGPGGLLYVYDPPEESTGDTGLHAPVNPQNGKFFGLSHVSFCYDKDQATTTTEATTTSTTEAPTTSTTMASTTSTTVASTTTTVKPTTTTTVAPTTSTTMASTTSTTVAPTTSTTVKPTTTSTTVAPSSTTTVKPTTTSTTVSPSSTTTVKPTSTTAGPTSTEGAPSTTRPSVVAARPGQLPRTGSGAQVLLAMAGIILLVGGAAFAFSAKLAEKQLA